MTRHHLKRALYKIVSYEDSHQEKVGWILLSFPDQRKCYTNIANHAQDHNPLAVKQNNTKFIGLNTECSKKY